MSGNTPVTRPNLLVIFSDQQHGRALGRTDSRFKTPHLDRFAAESVSFTRAYCTTPQCSPSRSSMLTGLYPSKTGVWSNVGAKGGKPLSSPTIGAVLKNAGYHTGYFGKWHLGKQPEAILGWSEDFGVTGPETTDDQETATRSVDFIDRIKQDSDPFALFVSFNNPHDIYHFEGHGHSDSASPLPKSWIPHSSDQHPTLPAQFLREDQGKLMQDSDEKDWQAYREFYAQKVTAYDKRVGQILNALQKNGLAESTIVIVTSDHGDMDGHHGLIFKGPFMYEQLVNIPLMIRLPHSYGVDPGTTRDELTSNVDLVPTLLDFAQVSPRTNDGISLRPTLLDVTEKPPRDFIICQYHGKQSWVNPIRMIRTKRYKLNVFLNQPDELFDLQRDPDEVNNLASSLSHAATKRFLRDALETWIKDNDDPFHTLQSTNRDGTPL